MNDCLAKNCDSCSRSGIYNSISMKDLLCVLGKGDYSKIRRKCLMERHWDMDSL